MTQKLKVKLIMAIGHSTAISYGFCSSSETPSFEKVATKTFRFTLNASYVLTYHELVMKMKDTFGESNLVSYFFGLTGLTSLTEGGKKFEYACLVKISPKMDIKTKFFQEDKSILEMSNLRSSHDNSRDLLTIYRLLQYKGNFLTTSDWHELLISLLKARGLPSHSHTSSYIDFLNRPSDLVLLERKAYIKKIGEMIKGSPPQLSIETSETPIPVQYRKIINFHRYGTPRRVVSSDQTEKALEPVKNFNQKKW